MVTTINSPRLTFDTLCSEQGKKKSWVAQRAGLTVQALGKRLRGRRGYPWKPGEQEAVARALGVPVTIIWPDYVPAAAEAEAEAE